MRTNLSLKIIFIIALSVLLIQTSYAQSFKKEPGYIILKSGEKKLGEISWNAYQQPMRMNFIENESTQISEFTTFDLQGFGTVSGLYFSENKNIKTDQFIQFLFEGEISLYSYAKKLLLETQNGEIIELPWPEEDRNKLLKNLGAISIVTIGDCNPTSKVDLKSFVFEEKTVVNLLEQYHKCKDLAYTKHYYKYKFAYFNGFFGAGINMSAITDSKKGISPIEISSSRTISPNVTVGLTVSNIIKIPKRVFVDLLFAYSAYNKELFSRTEDQSNIYTGTVEYKVSNFQGIFSVNYNILENESRQTYLGAGILYSNNIVNYNYSMIDISLRPVNDIRIFENQWYELNKDTISPIFKFGHRQKITKKNNLITEFSLSHTLFSEKIFIGSSRSDYNQINGRFLIGLTF